jgi:predicted DNA-binding protein (MmcQ/YjbR family)
MKYYDEQTMTEIRTYFEDRILQWSEVSTRKMFGCPCYKHQEKLFSFLVTNGIVLIKTTKEDNMLLKEEYGSFPFQAQQRTMKSWITVPVSTSNDVEQIMPLVRKSYELVVTK